MASPWWRTLWGVLQLQGDPWGRVPATLPGLGERSWDLWDLDFLPSAWRGRTLQNRTSQVRQTGERQLLWAMSFGSLPAGGLGGGGLHRSRCRRSGCPNGLGRHRSGWTWLGIWLQNINQVLPHPPKNVGNEGGAEIKMQQEWTILSVSSIASAVPWINDAEEKREYLMCVQIYH